MEERAWLDVRREHDLAACIRALVEVHATDQYPTRWPADPAAWLSPAPFLAAWVARVTRRSADACGHIALSGVVDGAGDDAGGAPWLVDSGLPAARLAEVGRLFVAPDARGLGLGARLLEAACAEARRRGLRPALKVLDHDRAAMALYDRAGWRRVATVETPWVVADPSMALLHYYLGPE